MSQMPLPTSPTQFEIATAAGVSRSTVSRALKSHPSISQATRERIVRLAEEMGYHENPFVTANMQRVRRAHPSRNKAIIAFLTPVALDKWFSGVHSYRKIYEGVQQQAHELGFDIDPISLHDQGISDRRCNDIMQARGIDGVLIAPFENPFVRIRLDWSRYSVATLGFIHIQPRLSYAACNHHFNMNLTLRHLRRLGYQRIGLAIPGRADRYAQGMFQSAYLLHSLRRTVGAAIPPLVPAWLKDWNRDTFIAWFQEHQPDAIVCLTRDVRDWLDAENIAIPDEVGLAILSHHRHESDWSGIEQNTELVGAAGVRIISEQLMLNKRGRPEYPSTVYIEGDWVDGGTTRHSR
jgi:DNA-binding LacI/PurR family transcriptional regulator